MPVTWIRAVAIGGLCLALGACDQMRQHSFVSTCEAVLKDTLKSPSSYRRIKLTYIKHVMTLEEYGDETLRLSNAEIVALSKSKDIYKHTALIKYDAKNAFNVDLRDYAICEFIGSDSDKIDEYSIKLNGKGMMQRLGFRP